ncbi:MAG: tRNA (adenosine(37)-N6)-threonylcarbamoyltransferase complex dimerization subunit type 1 TsaB [Candidatus Omnitrophica bacterium]|nr:tRNA (adenosine(37)-N6)-threonylcarbamoyltransferase complex dimerization subunit type 1 TsaB [Candidatus Omnitrophota bacterium]
MSKKVNFLAVDATSENLSLYIRYEADKEININHRLKFGASKLISYIDKVMKRKKIDLSAFDAFVVGCGPGSFTGLRISFSVIKAFMIAKGKPAIAIPSFYSCAYPLRNKSTNLAVVSDARRGLIYLSCFKAKAGNLAKDGRERLISLEELIRIDEKYLLITYEPHLRDKLLSLKPKVNFYSKDIFPKAKYLMPLAELYYNKNKFTTLDKLKPLYLHPKTCQVRKRAK